MSLLNIYREDCEEAGVVSEFDRLIKAGNTPQFAAMIAMRTPPGYAGCDRSLLEGDVIHHGLQGYPDWYKEHCVKEAKRAGIPITGKVFKSSLADDRGPGCPEAWIGGTDDILAACKKRNLTCRGIVNYQGYQPDPTPDCPLSEDLIQETIPEFLAENPSFRNKPDQLRDAIIEKHGAPAPKKQPKKTKKPGGGPAG